MGLALLDEEAPSDVVREFSFYSDTDFVPTERYGPADASRAVEDARFAVSAAAAVIPQPA